MVGLQRWEHRLARSANYHDPLRIISKRLPLVRKWTQDDYHFQMIAIAETRDTRRELFSKVHRWGEIDGLLQLNQSNVVPCGDVVQRVGPGRQYIINVSFGICPLVIHTQHFSQIVKREQIEVQNFENI